MKYLSGATGYTILSKNNKDILLLADIHDGVNYCINNMDYNNIDDFLNEKSNNYQILLEESIIDPSLDLTDLWPNSEHTSDLKNLKETNNKIIPTDIRPYLIPFSWQLYKSNKKYKECPIKKYLFYFYEFFNNKGHVYENYIFPYYEFINDNEKIIFINIFINIKNIFLELAVIHDGKLFSDILKDVDSNSYKESDGESYMHSIDNINSLIMEYYMLLLIFSEKRASIIHTGLAHSTRIKLILVEKFNFQIVEDVDMTHIDNYTGSDTTNACIIDPSRSTVFRKNNKSMFI